LAAAQRRAAKPQCGFLSSRHHDISKTNVNLQFDDGRIEHPFQSNLKTCIFFILPHGNTLNGLSVENHPIVFDSLTANCLEGIDYSLDFLCAISQQVKVMRRSMRRAHPQQEQVRSFHNKSFTVRRTTDSIQKTLDSIAGQDILEVFSLPPGVLEEPALDGSGQITQVALTHDTDSR
jgi:hypothetical protein